jgi:hypothetical protein
MRSGPYERILADSYARQDADLVAEYGHGFNHDWRSFEAARPGCPPFALHQFYPVLSVIVISKRNMVGNAHAVADGNRAHGRYGAIPSNGDVLTNNKRSVAVYFEMSATRNGNAIGDLKVLELRIEINTGSILNRNV